MQLFISYAHVDETFVQQLDAALAQHNIEAWYDRKPGVARLSHRNFTRLSNASNLLGQSAKSSSAS